MRPRPLSYSGHDPTRLLGLSPAARKRTGRLFSPADMGLGDNGRKQAARFSVNLQPFLVKFQAHLNSSIFVNEVDLTVGEKIRRFCKWWFDLLKNILLVTALNIFSQRTDSWFITGLYVLSLLMLLGYWQTYVNGWFYFPFRSHRNRVVSGFVSSIVAVAISFIAVQTISTGGTLIIDRLAEVQTH